MANSVGKLLSGLLLRCPRCKKGHVLNGWFTLASTCEACGVRFERSVGEGTGAMIITLSAVPLPMILLFILLYRVWGVSLPVLLAVMMLGVVVFCLICFRHARGVWVAIIDLTGGLYTDEEFEHRHPEANR